MGRKINLRDGNISSSFKKKGINSFRDACEYVNQLPYKRNSTKDDPLIVLKESCGTCSSKHELIKRLADENGIGDCKLILCMFKMSAENTSGVKSVLEEYGLEYIPEAHTYIEIDGKINDLTFPNSSDFSVLKDVLFTEEISADQIQFYKEKRHKEYLKEWLKEAGLEYSFEEIWGIREACILALSS